MKDDWIVQRLLNWQRWIFKGETSGLGYARVDVLRPYSGRSTGYVTARIPTDDCEAAETDAAVRALAEPLASTVVEYYLGSGGEAEHLQVLGCASDTMYSRMRRANRLLAEHFEAHRQARRAERARVEQLQREPPKT